MNELALAIIITFVVYWYSILLNITHEKLTDFTKWHMEEKDLEDSIKIHFVDNEVVVSDSPIPLWEVCSMDERGRAFFWDDLKFLFEEQYGKEVKWVGIHLKL